MAVQCSVQCPRLIMIDTGLITDMLQTMDTWSPTAGYLPGSASSFATIIWNLYTEAHWIHFVHCSTSPATGTVQISVTLCILVIVNNVRDCVTLCDVT